MNLVFWSTIPWSTWSKHFKNLWTQMRRKNYYVFITILFHYSTVTWICENIIRKECIHIISSIYRYVSVCTLFWLYLHDFKHCECMLIIQLLDYSVYIYRKSLNLYPPFPTTIGYRRLEINVALGRWRLDNSRTNCPAFNDH